MTIAIGGWVLLACAAPIHCNSVGDFVRTGAIVRGFDTAEGCEEARAKLTPQGAADHACLPALALVYR